MLHRRSTALVAVMLLAAALTSCGFDTATNRVNTIGAGTNNREASVDVLGARVVAHADGEGRLIGALAFNENDAEPVSLDEVTGEGVTVAGGGPTGIEVNPNEHVNLAADDVAPIPVEGEFAAGEVIELTYTFSTGEVVTLEVPVVKSCGQYADIAAPGSDTGDAAEDVAEEDGEALDEEADATYLCEQPTETAEGEEGGH